MSINKKKLIKELLSGNFSQEKRQEISELESVNKELNHQWEQSGKILVSSKTKSKIWKGINEKRSGTKRGRVHIVLWQSIAACASILLIIGGLWYTSENGRKSEDAFIEIAATYNFMHILPDSSKVWMECGSKIKYHKEFNKDRSVWLSGNSLFEVYKHEGSKFKVYIDKAFIEVKGTCFRIEQRNPNRNYITLFRGKIEFNIEKTGQKMSMNPFERVIYNPSDGHTELNKVTNFNWENGKYYFTDMPLQKLVKVINNMYNSEIILDKEIKHESAFTGSIRYDEPLEDVINKICFTLNLSKEMHEGNIIIKN